MARSMASNAHSNKHDSSSKLSMTRPPILTGRPKPSSSAMRVPVTEVLSSASRPPIIRPALGRSGPENTATTRPSVDRSTTKHIPLDYGVIVAVKETFGFIQPFQGDEQVYFSERELYEGISVGQEVNFIKRPSSKGFHAERLVPLHTSAKEYIHNLTAVIVREADSLSHRATPGLVEISEESLKTKVLTNPRIASIIQANGPLPSIPFFLEDIQVPNSGKIAKKLFKGDEVSLSLCFIAGSIYLRATSIIFIRGKRERLLQEQIQKMLEAGVKREQGIIDTIKNEEYGFIRPAERPEQIYFRLDDVVDESTKLEEGMEVEFFVIAESFKGKLCDRAVHLNPIPAGTVKFEVTITTGVEGYVLEESIQGAHEQPGKIRLVDPVKKSIDSTETLSDIELWSRCLPSDLILHIGDHLRFDIQHYRPENLYFARSVQVVSYQRLSREYGSICSIKEYGFGFIRSHIRDMDLYFRTAEVRDGNTGELIAEESLQLDMVVSFNVLIDDSSNFKGANTSTTKLKAIRIQTVSSKDISIGLPGTVDNLRVGLLERHCRGVVVKDVTNKRDSQPGQIQMPMDDISRLRDSKSYQLHELAVPIREFLQNPVTSSITIKFLSSGQRKAYHEVINNLYDDSLIHESVDLPKESVHISDPAKGKGLIITKKSASGNHLTVDAGEKNGNEKSIMVKGHVNVSDDGVVFYQKQDVDEVFGPLAKGLEVTFDLYVDKRTFKRVAKNVRLTDDPIIEDSAVGYGVIESIVGVRTGRFGFLRRIPDDEKLFWHSTSIVSAPDGSNNIDFDGLQENQEVSFDLRRRGGMRCAANIRLLPANSLFRDDILDGHSVAIVVDTGFAVVVDGLACAELSKKLWDIQRLDHSYDQVSSTLPIENMVVSDVKYYPAIPRIPISITNPHSLTENVAIGLHIHCHIKRNAALSRQPTELILKSILPETECAKVKKLQGVISRIKIKPEILLGELTGQPPSSTVAPTDSWYGLEFCEIQSSCNTESSLSASKNLQFYCLYAEIQTKGDAPSPDKAKIGDKVEFFAMANHRVALYPMLLPAITFRRIPQDMKASAPSSSKASGSQGIQMAKGPPTDSAVGFGDGWRPEVDVSSLPWSHLFS